MMKRKPDDRRADDRRQKEIPKDHDREKVREDLVKTEGIIKLAVQNLIAC